MEISATVIEDSVSASGSRLTTFVLSYPRFVHCFDDKTEVLAEINKMRRFYPWSEVINHKGKIAAYAEDGSIKFETPSAYIAQQYEGQLLTVENQRLNFSVTPEHRMYVGSRKSYGDQWGIVLAKDLYKTQKRFKTFGFVADGTEVGTNKAKLLGFFVGDGTLPSKGRQGIFHLKKTRKIEYLHSLLKELNLKFTFSEYEDGTSHTRCEKIPEFEDCYTIDGQKCIPNIIFNGTPADMFAFMDGLWNSDGSTDKGYCSVFNTSSIHVANGLNTIAAMCGEHINLTNPYSGIYKLTRTTETEPILRRDKTPVQSVDYKGIVYCATVSTGLLLVRRKGIVHISGNCELLTHTRFGRNASSSRAIPIATMIDRAVNKTAYPVEWGSNQKGMQAGPPLSPKDEERAKGLWKAAAETAAGYAKQLADIGVHKQIANRLIENFQNIEVVVTSSHWANFYALRNHKDAQPEIKAVASKMLVAHRASVPKVLAPGEWHLPFVSQDERNSLEVDVALKISAARCARVSYLTHDKRKPTLQEDLDLFDRLMGGDVVHASPTQHQARTRVDFDVAPSYGGNLGSQWVQFRKLIPNENISVYEEFRDIP